jgi:hypothetical protein
MVIERKRPNSTMRLENKKSTRMCKYNFKTKKTPWSLILLVRVMAAWQS